MCLDGLSELVAASQAAQKAVDELRAFDADQSAMQYAELTPAEIRTILRQRVADTEATLRTIGYNPPPKRVAEGDAAAELAARGVTLPGELPKSNEVIAP